MWTIYTNNSKDACTQAVHGQIRQDLIRFELHKARYAHIEEKCLIYLQNLISEYMAETFPLFCQTGKALYLKNLFTLNL